MPVRVFPYVPGLGHPDGAFSDVTRIFWESFTSRGEGTSVLSRESGDRIALPGYDHTSSVEKLDLRPETYDENSSSFQ